MTNGFFHSIAVKLIAVFSSIVLLFSGTFLAHKTAPHPNKKLATAVVATDDDAHRAVASALALPVQRTGTTSAQSDPTSSPMTERVIVNQVTLPANQDEVNGKLAALKSDLLARISQITTPVWTFSGPAESTPVSFQTFAQSQKIDNLSGVMISNATVSGVSGLTDADIPDTITASNYLPLSGGTLAGDLTINGNFTLAGAQTLSGAITIPYLVATSTNATSTFSGGLSASGATLLRSYNGMTDIRFYGAICDGSTNIASAVTAAVQAGAKKIFLPANCVYMPPSNTTPAGVEIDGENWQTSIISVGNRNTDILYLGATSTIKDVGIVSNFCDTTAPPALTQKICPVQWAANSSDTAAGIYNYPFQKIWFNGGTQVTQAGGPVTTDLPNAAFTETAPGGDSIYTQTGIPALGLSAPGASTIRAVTAGSNDIGIYLLNGYTATSSNNPHTGIWVNEYGSNAGNLNASIRINRVGDSTSVSKSLLIDDTGSSGNTNTSAYINLTLAHQTGGSVLNVFQTTTPFSGDFIHVNSDNSNGTFTGNYFQFVKNTNTIQAKLDSSGNLSLAGNGDIGGTLALDSTSGTTTIASGQGFTIGSSQFVLQQGSGNVGIGTASPASALDIESAAATAKIHLAPNSGTPFAFAVSSSQLGIQNDQNSKEAIYLNDGSDFIAFHTNTTRQMVLNASGQVGIGTTSPWARLSIAGAAGATTPVFVISTSTSLSATSTAVLVDQNGNVGIGTTSPPAPLSVAGNTYLTGGLGVGILNGTAGALQTAGAITGGSSLAVNGTSGTTTIASGQGFTIGSSQFLLQQSSGNVGIGTASPTTRLTVIPNAIDGGISVKTSDNSNSAILLYANATRGALDLYNSGTKTVFLNANSGASSYVLSSFGVATSSPWRTFSVTGTVGFDGLTGATGAGSVCLDANRQLVYNSGSDACLSSLRSTKHGIADLSFDAITMVKALDPVSFVYNTGDGRTRYGFIAEDTAAVDSHLATYDASGTISGIDDRAIISIIVKALKDLIAKLDDLGATVAGFATRFHTHELCLDDTCVTKTQLEALLQNSAQHGEPLTVPPGADTHTDDALATSPAAVSPADDQPASATTDFLATSSEATSDMPPLDNP